MVDLSVIRAADGADLDAAGRDITTRRSYAVGGADRLEEDSDYRNRILAALGAYNKTPVDLAKDALQHRPAPSTDYCQATGCLLGPVPESNFCATHRAEHEEAMRRARLGTMFKAQNCAQCDKSLGKGRGDAGYCGRCAREVRALLSRDPEELFDADD